MRHEFEHVKVIKLLCRLSLLDCEFLDSEETLLFGKNSYFKEYFYINFCVTDENAESKLASMTP